MLLRELEKTTGKNRIPFTLIFIDDPTGFGFTVSDGTPARVVIEQVVTKQIEFEQIFLEKLTEGFAETERSLSRRVFVQANKFWIIALDGSTVHLQFGGIRVNYRQDSGQCLVKDFPSREAALAAYHQFIAEKRTSGYREKFKRVTPFSKAPKPTAALGKPKATARKAGKPGKKKTT